MEVTVDKNPLRNRKIKMQSGFVSVRDAAAKVSLHYNTVRDAILQGELPARRRGPKGRYKIAMTDFQDWFNHSFRSVRGAGNKRGASL